MPAKTATHGPSEPRALYYYDLGSAEVDVSGYPPNQKDNYRLFLVVCGACHTTARPLNSPYAQPGEWRRFVSRMHAKMEARGVPLGQDHARRIIEFLVYDAKIRKIEGRSPFEAQRGTLKERFEKER